MDLPRDVRPLAGSAGGLRVQARDRAAVVALATLGLLALGVVAPVAPPDHPAARAAANPCDPHRTPSPASTLLGSAASVPRLLAAGSAAAAQEPEGRYRAGLVIQRGDEQIRQGCVAFDEPEITGLELLRRSGIEMRIEDHGGGQVTVCSLADEGCRYPEEPCFCACRDPGGPCFFWGYYTLDRSTGEWRFAEAGVATRVVRDGDVDAWRWGEHGAEGTPPPLRDFEEICGRPPLDSDPDARGATPPRDPAGDPGEPEETPEAPAEGLPPRETPEEGTPVGAGGPAWWGGALVAGALALLAVSALAARRRRERGRG